MGVKCMYTRAHVRSPSCAQRPRVAYKRECAQTLSFQTCLRFIWLASLKKKKKKKREREKQISATLSSATATMPRGNPILGSDFSHSSFPRNTSLAERPPESSGEYQAELTAVMRGNMVYENFRALYDQYHSMYPELGPLSLVNMPECGYVTVLSYCLFHLARVKITKFLLELLVSQGGFLREWALSYGFTSALQLFCYYKSYRKGRHTILQHVLRLRRRSSTGGGVCPLSFPELRKHIDVADARGMTALHYAVFYGNWALVLVLIQHGGANWGIQTSGAGSLLTFMEGHLAHLAEAATREDWRTHCFVSLSRVQNHQLTRFKKAAHYLQDRHTRVSRRLLRREWRPWRHYGFPPKYRATMHTLAVLAKARPPGKTGIVVNAHGTRILLSRYPSACLNLLPEELLQYLFAYIAAAPVIYWWCVPEY